MEEVYTHTLHFTVSWTNFDNTHNELLIFSLQESMTMTSSMTVGPSFVLSVQHFGLDKVAPPPPRINPSLKVPLRMNCNDFENNSVTVVTLNIYLFSATTSDQTFYLSREI